MIFKVGPDLNIISITETYRHEIPHLQSVSVFPPTETDFFCTDSQKRANIEKYSYAKTEKNIYHKWSALLIYAAFLDRKRSENARFK